MKNGIMDYSEMSAYDAAGYLQGLLISNFNVEKSFSVKAENPELVKKLILTKAIAVAISSLLKNAMENGELTEDERAAKVFITDGEKLKRYLQGSRFDEILQQWKICN